MTDNKRPIYKTFLIFVTFFSLWNLYTINPVKAELASPTESCTVEPSSEWTLQEKWVWSKLCSGQAANFNQENEYGGKLDPRSPNVWPKSRIITPQFIETIVMQEPYRSALPRQGVTIVGAWFKDPIEMSNAMIDHDLAFFYSRFDSDLQLSNLQSYHTINFRGSVFKGKLIMQTLEMGKNLYMSSAEFSDTDLRGSKISGQLDISDTKFQCNLNMNSLEVKGNLFMNKGEFSPVDLRGAKISGGLDMRGSKFVGKLDMDSLVTTDIYMGKAWFSEVVLRNAKTGGNMDMSESIFVRKLDMNNLRVDGSIFMRKAQFSEVDLIGAKIGSQLELTGSNFMGKLNMDSVGFDEIRNNW